ncbi:Ig-like domain-containing protein [Chryseobacterium sp. Leaf180]|uniref:Ig-like domain-containing protein n=1 Tax=Chryseobacterium sp. Leaf180 TaxID=1736289 RepID=UPI0009E794A8|nr:Ig-like domain-containing protein [Chryseobacterium sp. Leaf180]
MKNFFLFIIFALLIQSCARVGSPIGGGKDTIAPRVTGFNIDTSRVNVPRDIKQLRIDFDEYITLKDINKNLNVSPPIENVTRILPSNIANKYLLIQWSDTLQANTTYNFNFGNAIQDNNENNPLRYYNFAFSTGPKLDDLYISGVVTDALLSKKESSGENKMVVGLYQIKDTMDYRKKPYYISKVDDDGYYELNYLSPGSYKILAFTDENGNSVFDPGKEKIAFQKDPLNVEKSVSGLNLSLYPSKKPFKKPELKEVPGGVLMLFQGNPEKVEVFSKSEKLKDFKVTHNPKSDSVRIWFDAVKSDIGQNSTENLKFGYQADAKKDSASLFYKYNTKNRMTLDNAGSNLLPPKTAFKLTSNYYVDKINTQDWILKIDSTTRQDFTAAISETNPYQVIIKSDFISGKKYQLTVPKTTVSSFYERNADSKRFDFEIDKIENYGNLTLNLTNAPTAKYWVQLLDNSDRVVYQQYTSGNAVKFDLLKPGEYIVRILVDNNGNKYWDEADFVNNIFAEDSYTFYKIAVIRPLWEAKEDWDLKDTRVLDLSKMTAPKAPPAKKTEDELSPVNNNRLNNNNGFNNNNGLNNNGQNLQR